MSEATCGLLADINATVSHCSCPFFKATYVLLAGIDATGLDPDLDCHHLVVNDWHDLEASQNVCIISIPTVFDKSLAPAGKATIHAYVAANEPYDIWAGLDRQSKEYKDLKVMILPMWSVQAHGAVIAASLQQRMPCTDFSLGGRSNKALAKGFEKLTSLLFLTFKDQWKGHSHVALDNFCKCNL